MFSAAWEVVLSLTAASGARNTSLGPHKCCYVRREQDGVNVWQLLSMLPWQAADAFCCDPSGRSSVAMLAVYHLPLR